MLVARVSNLAQTVDELKRAGVWVYAAEAGGKAYYDTDFSGPCAVIFGSESLGVSHLLMEKSDFQVSNVRSCEFAECINGGIRDTLPCGDAASQKVISCGHYR